MTGGRTLPAAHGNATSRVSIYTETDADDPAVPVHIEFASSTLGVSGGAWTNREGLAALRDFLNVVLVSTDA